MKLTNKSPCLDFSDHKKGLGPLKLGGGSIENGLFPQRTRRASSNKERERGRCERRTQAESTGVYSKSAKGRKHTPTWLEILLGNKLAGCGPPLDKSRASQSLVGGPETKCQGLGHLGPGNNTEGEIEGLSGKQWRLACNGQGVVHSGTYHRTTIGG